MLNSIATARWASPFIIKNRKGSASSTDLSPDAIARTVQAALDIARYTSPDPFAGVADKELLAFDAPDLDLFHPAEVSPDEAIELAARAEQAALQADKRITNTEGGSFNSHYGIKVFGNSYGMLQSYCSTRHSLSSCVIAEEKRRYGTRLCLHHWPRYRRLTDPGVGRQRMRPSHFCRARRRVNCRR